jgi:hypothetical protein
MVRLFARRKVTRRQDQSERADDMDNQATAHKLDGRIGLTFATNFDKSRVPHWQTCALGRAEQ